METEATRAVAEATAAAKSGRIDGAFAGMTDNLRSANEDAQSQFLSEFTREIHQKGQVASLACAYAKAHFSELDLNKDGKLTSEDLTKLLDNDIYSRALDPFATLMVRYLKANNKEISHAYNDWGWDNGITAKDLVAHERLAGGKSRQVHAELADTRGLVKAVPAAEKRGAEQHLPDLVLEIGRKHFAALDHSKNGFVTRDELRKVLDSPTWSKNLTPKERDALVEMDKKYEQISNSKWDEYWYKDRKGITVKDLEAYAQHQKANRREFAATPGDHDMNITIGGITREAKVHIPPGYDPAKPAPVVYALHYFRGNGEKMAEYTSMNAKADKENFVVVYPQAVGWLKTGVRQWNLDNKPTYRVDEMAYMSQLMDKVDRELKVDKDRVYVAGYSNGGMLAHEIASKMSDRVAAFASVSGCLNGSEKRPETAVPALLIHGTNDSLVPFNGRRLTPLFPRMLPFSASTDFWKSSNKTNETVRTEVTPGVLKEIHANKQSGKEVVVYTLSGNGHGWPGRPDSIDGNPCLKVKGEDLIWEFFAKHKKTS